MGKIFYISVTETLNRVVKVEAEDLDSAIDIIEDACTRNDLCLDYNDFVDREEEDVTEETEEYIKAGYNKSTDFEEVE